MSPAIQRGILPSSVPSDAPTRRTSRGWVNPREPRQDQDNKNVRLLYRCAHCKRFCRHTSYHPAGGTSFGKPAGAFVCSRCSEFLDAHPHVHSESDLDLFQRQVKTWLQSVPRFGHTTSLAVWTGTVIHLPGGSNAQTPL